MAELGTVEIGSLIKLAGDNLDILVQEPGNPQHDALAPPTNVEPDELISDKPRHNVAKQLSPGRIYNTSAVKETGERWGMKLDFIDAEGPVVDMVFPGEAASRCPHLQPGHRVIEIAGVSVRGVMKPAEVMAIIDASGNALPLVLQAPETGVSTTVPELATKVVTLSKTSEEKWGLYIEKDAPGGPIITTLHPDHAVSAARCAQLQAGLHLRKVGGEDVTGRKTDARIVALIADAGNTLDLELGGAVEVEASADANVEAENEVEAEGVIEGETATLPQKSNVGGEDVASMEMTVAATNPLIESFGIIPQLQTGRCDTDPTTGDETGGAPATPPESAAQATGTDGINTPAEVRRNVIQKPSTEIASELVHMQRRPGQRWGFDFRPRRLRVKSVADDSPCSRTPIIQPGMMVTQLALQDVGAMTTQEINAIMQAPLENLAIELELQRQVVHISKQPSERWGVEFDAQAPRGPTITGVARVAKPQS